MTRHSHFIRGLSVAIGIAALWFAIRTVFFNITVIYENLSPASILASIFYWLHSLYFDIQNISSIPQYFGFWDYVFYIVNFSSPVLSILLAKVRKDDTPLTWLVICLIFPFAILFPAVLPEKYINTDPYSENCDNCGKSGECKTYTWKAGRALSSKVTGVTRSGNVTTTTTTTTYGYITSLSTHLCQACFRRKLNLRRAATSAIALAIVVVFISTFKHFFSGAMAAEGLLLFVLVPLLITQRKHFRKGEPEFHSDLFKPYARRKLAAIDRDAFWDQDEFSRL
jgi:hypothetical protein